MFMPKALTRIQTFIKRFDPLQQTEKFKAEFLNRVQIKQLLAYLEGTSIYLPTYLCTVYGFRRSEVLGLKWHNIDFENETIGLGKPYSKAQRKLAETVIIHHPQRQKAVTEPCQ